MKAPKSKLAKKILKDDTAARDLVEAIRKNQEGIRFQGRKISIRKVGKSGSGGDDSSSDGDI